MAHGYCNYSRTFKNATRNRQDLNYDWSFYSQASSKNLSMPLSVAKVPQPPRVPHPAPQKFEVRFSHAEVRRNRSSSSEIRSSTYRPPPQYLKYDLGNNSLPLAPCIQFHGASKWNWKLDWSVCKWKISILIIEINIVSHINTNIVQIFLMCHAIAFFMKYIFIPLRALWTIFPMMRHKVAPSIRFESFW